MAMNATHKTVARLLPLLAILAVLPFSICSCTKVGDEPEGPTGPASQYNPQMNTPGAKIVVRTEGSSEPGGVFALSAAFTDGDGRPVAGIPLTVQAETGTGNVVGYFTFEANPNVTDAQGRISTHVTVADSCPPGSYTFVVSSAPGGVGPVNGPYARGFGSVYVGAIAGESVSTPSAPTGNANPAPSTSVTYDVAGSQSSFGHAIQYTFNWGDGSSTGPVPADSLGQASASHMFALPATCPTGTQTWSYFVTVQAQCVAHPTVVSPISPRLVVTLTRVCP